MAEPDKQTEQPETGLGGRRPGTQPADVQSGAATGRLQATQALFRPDFDDDDDDSPHISLGALDTDPQDRMTVATRSLPAVRQLGGGLVEIPRVTGHRSARSPDDQPGGTGVQAVLLELRKAGRPVQQGNQGYVGGLVPVLRQPVFVSAPAQSRRHRRQPVRGQGLHRTRRAGLGLSGGRPQRQRPAGGAQGLGALRRRGGAGDRDGRAAVPRRGGSPADRADLQLRRTHRPARRIRSATSSWSTSAGSRSSTERRETAGRRGRRLPAGNPARAELSAFHRPGLQRPEAGEHHAHRRAAQVDRPGCGVADQFVRIPLWHTGLPGARDRAHRPDGGHRHLHGGPHTGRAHAESADPQRSLRRRAARATTRC